MIAFISGVVTVSKDAFKGTSTNLLCKITGLSAKAKVEWKEGAEILGDVEVGTLNAASQTSTLTVTNPQEDAVYTCVVTSGQYTDSNPSNTQASLNTYCKLTQFDNNFYPSHFIFFYRQEYARLLVFETNLRFPVAYY